MALFEGRAVIFTCQLGFIPGYYYYHLHQKVIIIFTKNLTADQIFARKSGNYRDAINILMS